MNNELEIMWTETAMNKFMAPSLHLPGHIRKPLKASIITVYGPYQHDDSINIHSFRLSYDKSKASSKANSPHSAI
jgi:hypothetical protein